MPIQSYVALLKPPGTRVSTADLIQHKSQSVCKLLQADPNHPNLMPVEEEDWASLLETAGAVVHHE